MYWQEWSESLVSGSLGFKWSYVRGIDFVIISLYSDAVLNRNADYTGKHWHQPCFIKEAIRGSFVFKLIRKNRWISLSYCFILQTETVPCHPKKETVVDLIRSQSFLPCTEPWCIADYVVSDQWVTVWCTVTKATRRSKSSTENVKVICIFTFIWGVGSAPCSPLFFCLFF